MCEDVKIFAEMTGHEQDLNILTAGQKEPDFEDFVNNGLEKSYYIINSIRQDKSNN